MPDHTMRSRRPDVVAPRLATCDGLSEQHARLRARGVHSRDGGWVVARRNDIAAALALPTMSVAIPGLQDEPAATAARQLQARMARFTDPPEHTRRRSLVEQLLPDPARLDAAAQEHTTDLLHDCTDVVDVMSLARTVPVLVLARALGVADDDLNAVAVATGQL